MQEAPVTVPPPASPSKQTKIIELSAPPKPPLAFRVGVVGHRPNRLQHADLSKLATVIREILIEVQAEVLAFGKANEELFHPAPPVLRAVSPLAEGTDRIFAEQALDLGWELCCVMPYRQEEYERDFDPSVAQEADSLERFRGLLERAGAAGRLSSFQLDGSRKDEGAAYGVGGRVVLNQSDLLIVVWDGERQGKRGGTEETLDVARRGGVPVIWVDARAPHGWRWLKPGSGEIEPAAHSAGAVKPGHGVRDVVRESLELPLPHAAKAAPAKASKFLDDQRKAIERFYKEHRPSWSPAVVWKAFRDIVGDSTVPEVGLRVPPFEASVLPEWPNDRSTPTAAMVDTLRPYYAWTDKPAVLNSDRYRSAFILAFLLSAVAVALALTPLATEFRIPDCGEVWTTVLELFAIGAVLFVTLWGRMRAWHQCWIDYRLAAELIRHLRAVVAVGGPRPFPQVPSYLATFGQPTATWMDWYVRAISRSIGLPNAVVDRRHLGESLEGLRDLLDSQVDFHTRSAARSLAIERRLHRGIVALLILTLAVCLLHLTHIVHSVHLLAALSGLLPALGAALAGINNQGEFRRIARRSRAMQGQLEIEADRVRRLKAVVEGSRPDEPCAARVMNLASHSASLMVQEVLDWRIVVLERPLDFAG